MQLYIYTYIYIYIYLLFHIFYHDGLRSLPNCLEVRKVAACVYIWICLHWTHPSSPQAVKRFLKQECKCHGVSGSCTLRTCWLAMADFRKTGNYLWRKYNGAIQVVMNQDGTGFTVANKRFKKPTKNDLVYFENSPDYCIRDRDAGKFKTLYSKYLILPRISTPQVKCSTVFSTC